MRKPLLNFSILSPANFKRWRIVVHLDGVLIHVACLYQ